MATVYSTGPAHAYVGFTKISGVTSQGIQASITSGPFYLGTAQVSPEIDIREQYEPVWNTLSGKVPFDKAWAGEDGLITYDFSRWDEAVIARIQALPRTALPGIVNPFPRGFTGPYDRGTLMLTEGYVPTLWVQFPFNAKAVYAANSLPAGYRFFAATFEGPHQLRNMGTKAANRLAVWHALPVYIPSLGDFVLYDHNMAGLPNPT